MMMDTNRARQILFSLAQARGVSGEEFEAAQKAARMLKKYGEVTVNEATSNLLFRRKKFDDGKLTVLLDAHIDEIGMVVSYITEDGFLKVSPCGGIDKRVVAAQQVTVLGKEKIKGVITSAVPHLHNGNSKVSDDIYVDVGMNKAQVEALAGLGSKVLIEEVPLKFEGGRVSSKALDDRAGCTAIIRAIELVEGEKLNCNLAVCFSSQEEVGERGAKTAAYEIDADYVIEADVSFAQTQGEDKEKCGILGKGPMIGFSPVLNKNMSVRLKEIAQREGIPFQMEVMPGCTGTNADVLSVNRTGAAAAMVSIPIKYMHTPVEIADLEDIENTARLIAAFLCSIKEEA